MQAQEQRLEARRAEVRTERALLRRQQLELEGERGALEKQQERLQVRGAHCVPALRCGHLLRHNCTAQQAAIGHGPLYVLTDGLSTNTQTHLHDAPGTHLLRCSSRYAPHAPAQSLTDQRAPLEAVEQKKAEIERLASVAESRASEAQQVARDKAGGEARTDLEGEGPGAAGEDAPGMARELAGLRDVAPELAGRAERLAQVRRRIGRATSAG